MASDTWASTPLEHWGSQVERRRRENRGAVGGAGEGGWVWGGAVPLVKLILYVTVNLCLSLVSGVPTSFLDYTPGKGDDKG